MHLIIWTVIGGGEVKLNQFYSLRCLKSKILAIIHKKCN